MPSVTSAKLLTKNQYYFWKVVACIYVIAVFAAIVFAWMFWKELEWYYKVLITFFVATGAFSLTDLKDLAKSYEQYKNEWEELHNK